MRGGSVRSLAAQTGWGRPTVHEWLVGSRLPSAQQLEDLLGAVDTTPQRALEIERLRSAAAHRPDPVDQTGTPDDADDAGDTGTIDKTDDPRPPVPATTDTTDTTDEAPLVTTSRRGAGRPILAGVLGLVAVVAFVGGFATGRTTRVLPPAASELPLARVQGTLGRGLASHRGPDGATERVGSLYEGQVVHIACISPTGSRIEDDTMHEVRHDWALLSDGTWVSVLYLDIHREWTPPQPPPPPLVTC